MKTKIRQPDPAPRTIQSKTKAANQASVETILQRYADRTVQAAGLEEDELLQGKFEPVQREALGEEDELLQGKFEPVQRQAENRTGLPDSLKSGVENLSGFSMDDVRVHYNSAKPAQLQALAYTQGTDIHVAPGQEKHLPHEAWHVVQQKQGRVQPTMQLQGVNVNDNAGLEKEADVMDNSIIQSFTASEQIKTGIESQKNGTIIQMIADEDCTSIVVRRINARGPKHLGHWWTEINPDNNRDVKESYGWWPQESVSGNPFKILFGVPGTLNGQARDPRIGFRGTPTRDPDHGHAGGETLSPRFTTNVQTNEQAMIDLRRAAVAFNGDWKWPTGPNCHTFQRHILDQASLTV